MSLTATVLCLQGVLLGYVLLDLAFDLDALQGIYEPMRAFYLTREAHGPINRLAALMPLPLLLGAQVWATLRSGTTHSRLALVFILMANGCGMTVMGIRKELAAGAGAGLTDVDKENLVKIAYLHLCMAPLVILGVWCTARSIEQQGSSKKKSQ